jgi:hypothetical protein
MEEWSAWRPGCFIPDTNWLGCWVCPRGGLEALKIRCISFPFPGIEPRFSGCSVCSLFTVPTSRFRNSNKKKNRNKTIHTRPNQDAPLLDVTSPSKLLYRDFFFSANNCRFNHFPSARLTYKTSHATNSVLVRCNACLRPEGKYFQHLL